MPEIALGPGFTDWPDATLAGVHRHDVRRHPGRQRHLDRRLGQRRRRRHLRADRASAVNFMQFLRIGLPIAALQLLAGAALCPGAADADSGLGRSRLDRALGAIGIPLAGDERLDPVTARAPAPVVRWSRTSCPERSRRASATTAPTMPTMTMSK
ncbi:MAG: hypothetical protein MZV49_06685 [Rhodopseudomonas palustris]|nr:hypothetical protein [Rhodopseudomonas palustris]